MAGYWLFVAKTCNHLKTGYKTDGYNRYQNIEGVAFIIKSLPTKPSH